jgi:hypothetical protein
MADEHIGTEPYMTVREMVTEIRIDVKELREQAARMETARKQLDDHERRIRITERWVYGIPLSGFVAVVAAVAALLTHA